MKTEKHDAIVLSSSAEKDSQSLLTDQLLESPIPPDELLANLGLFLTSKNLSRVLFFYEIYKKIVNTHGVICEFGVRWGQTLSILSALRGIFEPFNRHRKIIGFDTFTGLRGVGEEDGKLSKTADNSFSVTEGYEERLEHILTLQEALNPISHLKKFELVKGDACETIPAYMKRQPETLISLAIFDFDIYKPTKAALEAVKSRLYKGSVLVFDELCDDYFPGETQALLETFNLSDLRIQRHPMTARVSYAVIE
ncbi:crotonobetainyl-CoA--carnitine CoA-transferase [uncultured Pseudodesulfovibrio sp.]|uniref:crotonobetainyl-CoA--carnitine CoA-transferase n=1 Tax=uncultured Pseudodesulfovibrio sp. TaxID=2035858 RepID=UPI0029C983D2|nr:crotonobetainyl-CoA--carnitine CoA-transferase [uncultured Pseudodesulfovibrio sp.]